MALASSALQKVAGAESRDRIFDRLRTDFIAATPSVDFSKQSVLDLGSGPRGYILRWAEMFGNAYATDLRDFSDAYTGTGVRFVKSDGITCELDDESVDVVVSHSVLEHVHDLDLVMTDINRMLKPGGYAYLTVAPLYFSPTGLHKKQEISNWEHLDPAHPSYLAGTPFYHARNVDELDMTGSILNKMTVDQFLGSVGRQPWSINTFSRQIVRQTIPPWVDIERFGLLNLLTKGIVFLGQKIDVAGGKKVAAR